MQTPSAVVWTYVLAWLAILAGALIMVVGVVGAARGWQTWDKVTFNGHAASNAVEVIGAGVALVGLNVALLLGLRARASWGQWLGVLLSGGTAVDAVLDLLAGQANLLAPLLAWLSYALFHTEGWFRESKAPAGGTA